MDFSERSTAIPGSRFSYEAQEEVKAIALDDTQWEREGDADHFQILVIVNPRSGS